MAPSWAVHPTNGDHYSAYNKPLAVIDWLSKNPPEEEWLVILDSDMLLREPFICKGEAGSEAEKVAAAYPPVLSMDCRRGHPIAAYYGYLIGSTNELAEHFLPGVDPRNDTSGGQPKGRRADQVGGIFVVHRDDMLLYMDDWVKFAADVRFYADVRSSARQRLMVHIRVPSRYLL
jgi:peptidyl serine alpha-galactosyltransferase